VEGDIVRHSVQKVMDSRNELLETNWKRTDDGNELMETNWKRKKELGTFCLLRQTITVF
jgi:hypothetical protein